LIDEVDQALKFSLTTEGRIPLDSVENYEEVRESIITELSGLRDKPARSERPLIYHLDVAAMYPNIILTNRLQPDAIVTDEICASCDYNDGPDSTCQRRMTWSWRGEHFVSTRGEYNMMRNQLEQEKYPPKKPNGPERSFHELPRVEQEALVKKRMSDYTRKVYGKTYATKIIDKESIVCQRENPFYVNTVRAFRDRRYEYKALLKSWKKNLEKSLDGGDSAKIDEGNPYSPSFENDCFVRLFANGSQMHSQLFLRICNEKRRTLVFNGNGWDRVSNGCKNYPTCSEES
jgi:DNA polymerase epsilon subunit 1